MVSSKRNGSEDKLTLMVLGRKARPPLKISLSRRLLTVLALAAAAIVAMLTVFVFIFVQSQFDLAKLRIERKKLLAQNARLVERQQERDRQFAQLSDRMRSMELTLEKVEEVEGRVRILSGMTGDSADVITETGPVTPRITDSPTQTDVARMFNSARDIMDRMNAHAMALRKSARYFSEQRSWVLQIPNRWPLRGWVTSVFGTRVSPFTGKMAMHNGLDIAAPEGAVIRAPAAGQVTYIGVQSGYGNVLVLQHGRSISTLYGHLTKSLIEEGQTVPAGAPIALVGNTGRSTGPHLHYEVRINNIPVNPKRFLPEEPELDQSSVKLSPGATLPQATQPAEPTWPSQPLPGSTSEPSLSLPPTLPDQINTPTDTQ